MSTISERVSEAFSEGNINKAAEACFPLPCGFIASDEWIECREQMESVSSEDKKNNVYYCILMALDALREGRLTEVHSWQASLIALRDRYRDNTPERGLLDTAIYWLNAQVPQKDNSQLLLTLSILYNAVIDEPVRFGYLCPTEGSPSVLRGAKDLSEWGKNYKAVSSIIKPMLASLVECEGVGVCEAAIAELCYEKNWINEASAKIAAALSSENVAVRFAGLCQLARINRLDSASKPASEILESIETLLADEPESRMAKNLKSVKARFDMEEGKLDEVREYLNENEEEVSLYCHDKLFKMITQGKAFIALGRYRDAVTLFEQLTSLMENDFRPLDTADCLANSAVACHLLGSDNLAEEKLLRAIKITRPYGYVRIYADLGAKFVEAFKSIYDESDTYLKEIMEEAQKVAERFPELYEFKKAPEKEEMPAALKMTGTEQAILTLLDRGLTNKEIAECMRIKVTTVKFHVKNILSKLGAKNRTEAVNLAKKFELIE